MYEKFLYKDVQKNNSSYYLIYASNSKSKLLSHEKLKEEIRQKELKIQ
jgi:hypothetical protein